ncbi:RNA-directed DNA polymerase, eukaryota, reverse transcriptase zinc-binding domain protein [Tanacetum coccineum]|uniref:RNA-directed DNA polymerase, eukaryota, reverse transcriptase zinc-binding domain protein n=1 Tax=Tanacetum coccineum TaxID=301880 RepID=A0ABQ4WBY1_9ASTR
MRSQRSIKIPLKFDNSVHSINNTKANKRRNALKNKGKDTECNSVDSGIDREEGDIDALGNLVEKMVDVNDMGYDGICVDVDCTDKGVKNNGKGDEEDNGMDQKSFVEAISENLIINDRNLECIPTELDENGVEVVVFDEVLVAEGIKRKPLVVQKWSVDLKIDSTELEKVPLWVRLCNLPVEAWTVKGISALASRIRKPLVMDVVTASKCKQGICMVREGNINGRKNVKVLYDRKPPGCIGCRVFGHAESNCPKKESIKINNANIVKENVVVQKENCDTYKEGNDGFVEVRSRKTVGIDNKVKRQNYKANPQNNKFGNNVRNVYQVKKNVQVEKEKTPEKTPVKKSEESQSVNGVSTSSNDKESPDKGKKKVNELRELQNKEIVDEFLNKNVTLKESDMVNWDLDMIAYYKQKMELLIDKREGNEEEDVLEEMNYIANSMKGNDVKGMDDGVLANGGLEKKDLWRDLEIYRRIVRNEAWFLSGDINVSLAPNEHSMGGSTMSSDMKDFNCCVNSIEMEDVNSSGLFFTWTKNLQKVKKGGQASILKKLDRIMGNEDFLSRFNQAYALFLPYIISDHCPTVLILPKCVKAKRKPFKFANFITEKEEFMSIVNQKNGDVFENVKKLRESVKEIQQRIDKDPHNNNLRSEEAVILKEYSEVMKEEELILYQKAKVKWLSVGDINNAYFHKAIKSRQQRNRIDAMCDEFGKRFEGSEVAEKFVSHFQKFLGESKEVEKVRDMESLLQNKLSNEDAAFMIREVCDEEIKYAMFQIDDNKAPSPDGFSAHKILTERIKGCLDKLVSKNQSAFIPNRHIQDNIMLDQELFKGYDRKMRPKRVALKVDIQKAYDTLN